MINSPFGDCKTTDLHLADSIQPFGAMLVIDARGKICAVSANSAEWLGEGPDALLGRDAASLLPAEVLAVPPAVPGHASGLYLQPLAYRGQELQAATHTADGHTIIEIESCPRSSRRSGREEEMLARGLKELGATYAVQGAAETLMRLVAEITGYDRVMLYQFLPEWHGKVVAEVCQPGVEGYLGLHFPAGDIPPNARRLYLVKQQRVIADVSAEPVPVLSASPGLAVDLTYSQLRAVHPVHIQYLKNMGVEASFSVSLVVAGRLWGLIACHHFAPRQVPFASRQLCEQLASMAAIHMGDLQRLALEQARYAYREALTHTKLELQALAGGKQGIATQLARIREAFGASGAWAMLDGHGHYSGDVPGLDSLALLKNWLEAFDQRNVFAFDRIDAALKKDAALVRFASGLLYVPLTERDFLLLMRAEQVEHVAWAGKPPDGSSAGAGQQAELTPRQSFQIWREETHGKAMPWQNSDVEAAELLRDLLTEHIERMRLERLALTDPLTGLSNRAMFERKLQEAIRISLRDGVPSAVYMIDLDRFKPVNDRYGHGAGDALLIEVAQRLRAHLHDRDVVARLGGDEFAIIQYRVAGSEEVEARAESVLAELGKPYSVQGHMIEIGASIGMALCPQHAAEQHELMARADLALYKAKNEGRNGCRLFDSGLLESGARPQSRRSELADAIERGTLHFVYQPILHAATRRLQGLEAYARWRHPERGEIEGGELLMLAEQHGLLQPFALWELRQIIGQAHRWQQAGLKLVPLSINLSVQQFRSVDLAARCAEMAKRHDDMSLEWLRLDVDGSLLQSGVATAGMRIAALEKLGVMVRVDHFGSSLLPLAELAKLRIDCLKAHGSMLNKLPGSHSPSSLGVMLCSIAKALQVPLVATRIETEAMLADAVACGCDQVQGFAVAPLLKAAEVPAWLKRDEAA